MKKYISGLTLALAIILSSLAQAQQSDNAKASIQWLTLEEAQQLSEKEPRKIIMDVYTDWCGWCKKMDKTTFADKSVVDYVNKNFYAVKLKADSNDKVTFKGQEFTNGQFAQALRVTGYPTIVFWDKNFSNFQPVSGYRQAEEFRKILEMFHNAEAEPKAGK